jgi:hypothetical protein
MKTDNTMICDFPGCESDDIEYTSDMWFHNRDSVLCMYWCNNHVPVDAIKIDWDEIMKEDEDSKNEN